MIYKHSMTFWHALHLISCHDLISRIRDLWLAEISAGRHDLSHMVIILRWKQGLNCVKRWLNTYYRMAGWYISTQWPSGMHLISCHDKLPWSRPAEICGLLRSRPADMTSHMVIILRWKQGLNCVKRWLNTYHRMAGWYISTQWPSGMHCAPDKLLMISAGSEICGLLRSRPADMTSHMVIIG